MQWDKLIYDAKMIDNRFNEPVEWAQYPISIFKKDYKIIIASSAFRRLQDKTQVFPLDRFVPAVLYYEEDNHTPLTKKHLELIPESYKMDYLRSKSDDDAYNLYLRLLISTDYISGMTDSYAKNLYQELNGIL